LVERAIYETILPNIPVSSPVYHGYLESSEDSIWLFVEDAGEEWYSRKKTDHRTLAAIWLAMLHGTALRLDAVKALPNRGPAYYLDVLREAKHGITSNLDNPALSEKDRILLNAILAQCDTIREHWSELELVCNRVPATLVHGDFVGKNVRVRFSREGPVLLPFDWESAGYGVPAADLEGIDISTYQSIIEEFCPLLSYDTTQKLSRIGFLFRLIHCIKWASDDLAFPWVAKTMRKDMPPYHAWLNNAFVIAGWQTENM
jgi:hypothetical protein